MVESIRERGWGFQADCARFRGDWAWFAALGGRGVGREGDSGLRMMGSGVGANRFAIGVAGLAA